MNDAGVKACVAMAMVTAIYVVYVTAHVVIGQDIPDGVLLTGVVAVVAGLGGYATAVAKAAAKKTQ